MKTSEQLKSEVSPDVYELLDALCGIMVQYMPKEDGVYPHACMGAGEDAAGVLMKYGLTDDDGYNIVPLTDML